MRFTGLRSSFKSLGRRPRDQDHREKDKNRPGNLNGDKLFPEKKDRSHDPGDWLRRAEDRRFGGPKLLKTADKEPHRKDSRDPCDSKKGRPARRNEMGESFRIAKMNRRERDSREGLDVHHGRERVDSTEKTARSENVDRVKERRAQPEEDSSASAHPKIAPNQTEHSDENDRQRNPTEDAELLTE